MTRLLAAAAWMAFACFPAQAQPTDSQPAFEVASVKLAPPEPPGHHSAHSLGGPGTPSPGQWTCSNYNLPELMMLAYGVERNRLSGPSWMETQGFDIVAKVPAGMEGEALDRHTQEWVDRVNRSGAAYLTPATLDGRWMARVSIGSITTEREHAEALWKTMRAEAERAS